MNTTTANLLMPIIKAFIHLKWSCWNPWAIGAMNLAWSKYAKTPMYEERSKLDREFKINDYNYDREYAFDAFIENEEFDFFYNQATFSERIRLILAPFSFGSRFRMPFWRIKFWILGVDESE